MAPPAGEPEGGRGGALLRLLAPSPERLEFALRQAAICALTVLVVEIYQTPDPALTTYLVFFMNKPDRGSSIVLNLVLLVLITIAVGDCATVYSMIDRSQPIKGIVQGIGAGVLDEDRINLPKSVPYVERSLNWVRVAQRFPVRIRLEHPPRQLTRLGASAVVQVKHGAACR